MDITNNDRTYKPAPTTKRAKRPEPTRNLPLHKRTIAYGVITGLLMTAFMVFDGFYITGDHAGVGFLKYLILAVPLGIVVSQVKEATPAGDTFKVGMINGAWLSATAAITTAVTALIVNNVFGADTIRHFFQNAADNTLDSAVLAGVTFFEGIVAGLILTFIWLQFYKDRVSNR